MVKVKATDEDERAQRRDEAMEGMHRGAAMISDDPAAIASFTLAVADMTVSSASAHARNEGLGGDAATGIAAGHAKAAAGIGMALLAVARSLEAVAAELAAERKRREAE